MSYIEVEIPCYICGNFIVPDPYDVEEGCLDCKAVFQRRSTFRFAGRPLTQINETTYVLALKDPKKVQLMDRSRAAGVTVWQANLTSMGFWSVSGLRMRSLNSTGQTALDTLKEHVAEYAESLLDALREVDPQKPTLWSCLLED